MQTHQKVQLSLDGSIGSSNLRMRLRDTLRSQKLDEGVDGPGQQALESALC